MSAKNARKVVKGKYPGFEFIEKKWLYQEKGAIFFRALVQEVKSGRFYLTKYRCGYKPSLGAMIWPYEREEPVFRQVRPVKKVIDSWEDLEDPRA
jgi:hypothetical protein